VRRGTGRMAVPWSQETGAAAPLQAEQEQDGPGYRHRAAPETARSPSLGEGNSADPAQETVKTNRKP
jgi:hypothetical protein